MPRRSSIPFPRDINQLAKRIVDIANSEIEEENIAPRAKNPAAVELGRLGGRKGGVARAQKLAAEDRRRIAANAAKARWNRTNGSQQ